MDPSPVPTASDGSPYPVRGSPTFLRDVEAMFAHIARGYDAVDHLISLGGDWLWRPRALWDLDRFTGGAVPGRILDLGCGPGTFTLVAASHFPKARFVGVDLTPPMLARARARSAGRSGRLEWARANALRLPFPNGSFDLVMSAFVVRNLPDLPKAFAELGRVLTPGGVLLTLEITEPAGARFRRLFHAYFDTVVPWVGAAFGSEGPYRYLPDSLRSLPGREELLAMMGTAGFSRTTSLPQSLGIVTTFLAQRSPTRSDGAQSLWASSGRPE